MKPIAGHWAEVLPGEYVRDKSGMDWRVDVLTASRLEMVSREGKQVTTRPPQPEAPVTRMVLEPAEMGEVVQRVLGPVTPTGPADSLPLEAFKTRPLAIMKMHLSMFHGIKGSGVDDSRSRKEMIEAHDWAHERGSMFWRHHHENEWEPTA